MTGRWWAEATELGLWTEKAGLTYRSLLHGDHNMWLSSSRYGIDGLRYKMKETTRYLRLFNHPVVQADFCSFAC